MKKNTLTGLPTISDESVKVLEKAKADILKARDTLRKKMALRDELQARLDGLDAEIAAAADQAAEESPGANERLAELTTMQATLPHRIEAQDLVVSRGIESLRDCIAKAIPIVAEVSSPVVKAANERVAAALKPYFSGLQATLLASTSDYYQSVAEAVHFGYVSPGLSLQLDVDRALRVIDRILSGDLPKPFEG